MDTLLALIFAAFILYLLYKEHMSALEELEESKRRLLEINRRQEIARISPDFDSSDSKKSSSKYEQHAA